jgi:hypothetical protein
MFRNLRGHAAVTWGQQMVAATTKAPPMSDPGNEENEYGEDEATKMADMDGQQGVGDDDEDPDMDNELTDDDDVPGERQATRLPGETTADANEI